MKRFGLVLDDKLYREFVQLFLDHGAKTAVLRKCVRRLVDRAKEAGGLLPKDIDEVADTVFEEERRKRE